MNYYNEFDPYAAQWLKNLIAAGEIPAGDVDTRSIKDVQPDDLKPYTQCHFFAGIGGWSLALRLAGFPDTREVWTASCPCQPYSSAGKQLGNADERDLWPTFYNLARVCRPDLIIGEQVQAAIKHGWLDRVHDDMERENYAIGATVLGAFSVGAPHKRSRLYWLAESLDNAAMPRHKPTRGRESRQPQGGQCVSGVGRENVAVADAPIGGQRIDGCAPREAGHAPLRCDDGWQRVMFQAECDPEGDGWCQVRDVDPCECDCIGPTQDGCEYIERDGIMFGRLVQPNVTRSQGLAGHGNDGREPGRVGAVEAGSTSPTGATGAMADTGRGDDGRGGRGESAGGGIARGDGPWSDYTVIHCLDGKSRRVPTQREFQPLVNGIPRDMGRGIPEVFGLARRARANRSGRLKGYGNAIVPQVAAEFISAWMEVSQ